MGEDSLEKLIRSLSNTPLVHTPGNKWEYSNINYGILGLIIQKVSGQSYERYIKEKIFDRLDMLHSHMLQAGARSDSAASGYFAFFGFPLQYNKNVYRAIAPWGGIYSSAEDLTHYLIAHLNEGRFGDYSIISADGISELHCPSAKMNEFADYSYAMGWVVGPYKDVTKSAIVHGGGWAGFQSFALLVPEKQLGVVLLGNISNPALPELFRSIGWDIAESYFRKTKKVTFNKLKKYQKIFCKN